MLFTGCASTKDVHTPAGPKKNHFRQHQLQSSAGAFGRLAGSYHHDEMGQALDAKVVPHHEPIPGR